MATYVSLDEAAKLLNITPENLVELRSRGEIFGFRDGSSWKFKTDEIERVLQERSGDVLDEDSGGSSILLSERSGLSGLSGKSGSVLGQERSGSNSGKSDLQLEPADDDSDALELGSDVTLVPDPSSGSGVRLVNRASQTPPLGGFAEDDDEILGLDDDDSGEMEIDASSLSLGPGSSLGLGSDLELANESNDIKKVTDSKSSTKEDSDVLAGSDLRLQTSELGGTPDLIQGDGDSDSAIELDDGLELSSPDDDLVLGSSSDLGLTADSGINLMSPSDSGLSLEDEPLDLAGTGISGLDLGSEGSGSDIGGSDPKSGVGSGISGIDFAAAEDFQLSPSGGIEVEDDSGSQVIEIEDSSTMGDPLAGAQQDPFGEGSPEDEDNNMGGAVEFAAGTAATGGVYRGVPEVPLAGWQVATLLCIVIFMGMSGILVTDIVRNMWSWNGESNISISSWFTKMIVDSLGWQG